MRPESVLPTLLKKMVFPRRKEKNDTTSKFTKKRRLSDAGMDA